MKRLVSLMMSCAALAACGEPAPTPAPEPAPAATPEAAAAPAADPMQGDGGVDVFYTPDPSIPAEPGKLIRTMTQPPETSLVEAGQAMRLLYSSTNGLGEAKTPIAVSGTLFLPKG